MPYASILRDRTFFRPSASWHARCWGIGGNADCRCSCSCSSSSSSSSSSASSSSSMQSCNALVSFFQSVVLLHRFSFHVDCCSHRTSTQHFKFVERIRNTFCGCLVRFGWFLLIPSQFVSAIDGYRAFSKIHSFPYHLPHHSFPSPYPTQ